MTPPDDPARERALSLSKATPRNLAIVAVRRTGPDGAPLVAVEVLAQEAGLHPELVRRLVALGALEPAGGTSHAPLFPRDAAARLRRDLGLNYAGALLACDLLARIDVLERLLARHEPPPRR
jgi:hypothetical protein